MADKVFAWEADKPDPQSDYQELTQDEINTASKELGLGNPGNIEGLAKHVGKIGFTQCMRELSDKYPKDRAERICGKAKAIAREEGWLAKEHMQASAGQPEVMAQAMQFQKTRTEAVLIGRTFVKALHDATRKGNTQERNTQFGNLRVLFHTWPDLKPEEIGLKPEEMEQIGQASIGHSEIITQTKTALGGQYTAVQNPDGSVTLKDVSVFITHKRFNKTVDESWLNKALKAHQLAHAEGHDPALYLSHDRTKEDEPIGYFNVEKIESRTYQGKDTPTLLADITIQDKEVYEKIKKEKIPYLSVEIASLDKPFIDALALLKSVPPYFKLPRITIGQEIKAQEYQPIAAHAAEKPLVAYCYSATGGGAFIFDFGGLQMDVDKTKQTTPALTAQAPEDEKKPKEKPDEEKEEKAQAGMEQICQEMLGILKSMAQKMGIGGGEETAQADSLKPVENPEPAKASIGVPVEYSARLTTLEKELKTLKQEKQVAELVVYAQSKLATYNLGEQLEEDVRYHAQHGGKESVDKYISTIERVGITVPPETFEKFTRSLDSQLPEEIKAYAAKSPEEFVAAKKILALYQELGESFAKQNPLDKFVKREFKRMKDQEKGIATTITF